MPDFLTSLIAVVVILGFMILIHEFGHYAVAKWLGVRIEVFSIGFGFAPAGMNAHINRDLPVALLPDKAYCADLSAWDA